MQQTFIIRQHHPRLLLFFAGWGMDETPFQHYHPTQSDYLICYDYRTLDFDESSLSGYSEIHLVAWSMGVWAASQVMQQCALPLMQRIAINGTPYPVNETKGIPAALFQGTLDGLNEASLLKFHRRMCADKHSFEQFQRIAPHRPIEELKEELAAIAQQQAQRPLEKGLGWQQAVVGEGDLIFPPLHQQEAWREQGTPVAMGKEAHYSEALFKRYLEDYE